MQTIDATQLKNHLGEVLELATLGPVAIARHGRLVAYLVPVTSPMAKSHARTAPPERRWSRRDEARIADLCAGGDFRPSRWLRAGDPRTLAGIAAMLGSEKGFGRTRMLALAERLCPGMSTPAEFNRWLAVAPIQAARLLPMLRARIHESRSLPPLPSTDDDG